MAHRSTVFAQLLKFLPKAEFKKLVDEYDGDKRSHSLPDHYPHQSKYLKNIANTNPIQDLIASEFS
ncbi:DUF4372 domain-containing protein [Saccharospirillum salsuginis]|uniref:DUF4372 domain-containing protein n=1 Tax=Saccharospirillum salsuginis TaxID=418750 RepID=A0A918KR90_9GAMM|nr:DUF4372 domain-containing protein [Saccharospirillum salsuginis]GGX72918.1 hypothetical protein GCM10007392_45350 [Saccharospirillum salsuginis]